MKTAKMMVLGAALVSGAGSEWGRAEEGASGHYQPGMTASCYDALPGKPGLAAFDFFTVYTGSAGGSNALDFAGDLALGADATLYANTVGAVYQSDFTLLGGSYAAALAIPYMWVDVKANSVYTGPGGSILKGKNVKDSTDGIGDITIYPFMLGWTALGGDLKYDFRLGVYAPTGSYEVGRLANTGKNYWTFEPGGSVSWVSSKFGTEATMFAGFDFNTENEATDYQTGTQFHLDLTLAQHLPLWGGFAGVGMNVFYYQQIEADSGAGAKLGAFEARTVGVGPAISYMRKIGDFDCFAEVKWLPELEVNNRTQGDYVWVKVGVLF